jgi:hypothetical protein
MADPLLELACGAALPEDPVIALGGIQVHNLAVDAAAVAPLVASMAWVDFHVLSALEHFTFVDDAAPHWAEIIVRV